MHNRLRPPNPLSLPRRLTQVDRAISSAFACKSSGNDIICSHVISCPE